MDLGSLRPHVAQSQSVKFDMCGEMNPLVLCALEGMNLVFTIW